MKPKIRQPRPVLALFAVILVLAAGAAAQTAPIALSLDASQVAIHDQDVERVSLARGRA